MLYAKFKKFVLDNALVKDGDNICVAVSGGVDSMVLFGLFCRLAKFSNLKISVSAVHVNHMLRGGQSDLDERLVRLFAEKNNISIDVLKKRPSKGKNLQDSARRIRYSFFKKMAEKNGSNTIATAHHMDDQAETILLHLLRGAGPKGLSGMRPKSVQGGMKLIRPLLFASRREIIEYAKRHKIKFRDDATNKGTKYLRNAVRLKLMPILEKFNPRIRATLSAMGERLALEDEALNLIATEAYEQALVKKGKWCVELQRHSYIHLPAALRHRVLRVAFERARGNTIDLNADQIRRMDSISVGPKKCASYRLPAPWQFQRDGEVLKFLRAQYIKKSKITNPRFKTNSNDQI